MPCFPRCASRSYGRLRYSFVSRNSWARYQARSAADSENPPQVLHVFVHDICVVQIRSRPQGAIKFQVWSAFHLRATSSPESQEQHPLAHTSLCERLTHGVGRASPNRFEHNVPPIWQSNPIWQSKSGYPIGQPSAGSPGASRSRASVVRDVCHEAGEVRIPNPRQRLCMGSPIACRL